VSQQPTDIQHTEKCDAKNGTKANLTQDVLYLLIVIQMILFHDSEVLKLFFAAVAGLEPATSLSM